MYQSQTTELQSKKNYYTKIVSQQPFRPLLINVNLASNPFLKDQQTYSYIIFTLNQFNKRVKNNQVKDEYQQWSYERLHSCISDLAQMQSRQDQILRLSQIYLWLKQQERLIDQRKDQGMVRYKTLNKVEQEMKEKIFENKQQKQPPTDEYIIPSAYIDKIVGPYNKHFRTFHKELDIPANRLLEYKRKNINIAPFIEIKQEIKHPRISYKAPPKYQEPVRQEEEDKDKALAVEANKEGELKEGQIKPGQVKQGEVKQEDPNQQDLGGFGEEPQEPQEDQKPDQDGDKLAPRIKAFTGVANREKKKYYRGLYMNYKGQEKQVQRRMEEQFWKTQNENMMIQRQDDASIEIGNDWGRTKSKIEKQLQKRLQQMTIKTQYELSKQPPQKMEKLSLQDQIKFGFTAPLRTHNERKKSFDLTNFGLPQIKNAEFNQKYMRKERLKSLKNKFGKLLNLTDFEERQTAPSICQYSSRRRGLSEVISNHSKSKERINQLEEVARIKQRLTRNKIGINIKALSQGLCLPQQEQVSGQGDLFPGKILPSNPFMVETKKKKKKK